MGQNVKTHGRYTNLFSDRYFNNTTNCSGTPLPLVHNEHMITTSRNKYELRVMRSFRLTWRLSFCWLEVHSLTRQLTPMLSFDKKTMIRRYSSNTVFFLYFFGHTFPTLHNCKDGRFKRWHPRFCSTCCHWDIHYTQVRHVAGGPLPLVNKKRLSHRAHTKRATITIPIITIMTSMSNSIILHD